MRLLHLFASALLFTLANARAFTSTAVSGDDGPTRTVTVTKTATVTCAWGFYYGTFRGGWGETCADSGQRRVRVIILGGAVWRSLGRRGLETAVGDGWWWWARVC